MEKQLKVLMWTDSPACTTGFGNVVNNIIKRLNKDGKYMIDVLGINHNGDPYDNKEHPYRIYPAAVVNIDRYHDLIGRGRFLDMLASGFYDLVWIQNDTFNVSPLAKKMKEIYESLPEDKKFVTIFYFPIDADDAHRKWITDGVAPMDFPVCYTEYGRDICKKFIPFTNVDVIYLSADTNTFRPVDKALIEEFKATSMITTDGKTPINLKNRFIVTNVNRNQIRKDYMRTFAAFKKFKEKVPNALLFCLCAVEEQGGNLLGIADHFNLEFEKDWIAPTNHQPGKGFSTEIVNLIYNMSDVIISTSTGEGFGLSIVEAMACKKPIIAPNHTSITELIGSKNERGILVPAGVGYGDHVFFGAVDNHLMRPTVDVNAMADALYQVYDRNNKNVVDKRVELAYTWVKEHSWDEKGNEWKALFDKAENKLYSVRQRNSKIIQMKPQ